MSIYVLDRNQVDWKIGYELKVFKNKKEALKYMLEQNAYLRNPRIIEGKELSLELGISKRR